MDNEHAVLTDYDTMDDMGAIKHHAHILQPESSALQDDRLFNEINLLRLEGYYFCLDPKDALRRTNEKYEFLEIIRRRKTEIEKNRSSSFQILITVTPPFLPIKFCRR